ncbi:MAG TPA: hypothetical protein VI756_03090 [Blastocatellia bacterium]
MKSRRIWRAKPVQVQEARWNGFKGPKCMSSWENFLADLVAYAREQELDPAPLLLLLAWTGSKAGGTDPPGKSVEALPDHYYPH